MAARGGARSGQYVFRPTLPRRIVDWALAGAFLILGIVALLVFGRTIDRVGLAVIDALVVAYSAREARIGALISNGQLVLREIWWTRRIPVSDVQWISVVRRARYPLNSAIRIGVAGGVEIELKSLIGPRWKGRDNQRVVEGAERLRAALTELKEQTI